MRSVDVKICALLMAAGVAYGQGVAQVGEPRVNVLELNLDLDRIAGVKP